MMIRKSILLLTIVFFSSCVSSKIYEDLKTEHDALKEENRALMAQMDGNVGNADNHSFQKMKEEFEKLQNENLQLKMDYAASQNNLKRLQDSYDALEANSSENLTSNLALNRDLLAKLQEKEAELAKETARLEKLKRDLENRSQRVNELESIIEAKESQMRNLKNAISAALTNFEGKGLTVEQRDGKVYVSMENKLLFESGSWEVGTNGKEAVLQLGSVLAENPEIAILIEGHTDNVPYAGSGSLQGNWDLSTKRATAIVRILSGNTKILKENITVAGRGEYAPINSNATTEGRAKNRRIEVILTPKLDEITKLLNEI